MHLPLYQLVSAAAEALANDVHELLFPSLYVPGRAAALAAQVSVTPQKSRQQQRGLQPPPRALPQEESSASAGGGAVAVAFKRRTVVTHCGEVVTSAAGDVSTATAVASLHEHGAGIESNSNDLLDDAMVASACPSKQPLPASSPSPLLTRVSGDSGGSAPPSPRLPVTLDVAAFVTVRAWNCVAMLLAHNISHLSACSRAPAVSRPRAAAASVAVTCCYVTDIIVIIDSAIFRFSRSAATICHSAHSQGCQWCRKHRRISAKTRCCAATHAAGDGGCHGF